MVQNFFLDFLNGNYIFKSGKNTKHKMSSSNRYVKADVFAKSYGGGNPLGVVIDGDNWNSEQMQKFAKWSDIVETTYVLKPTNPSADYKVRIFMPNKEIPFAGHPTIGTAYSLLSHGLITPKNGMVYQECANGIIPILVDNETLFLRSPSCNIYPFSDMSSLNVNMCNDVLSNLTQGKLPPVLIDGGRKWWVAEVESEEMLRTWAPAYAKIKILADNTASMGICLFARSSSEDYDIVVRAFPGGVGIAEDPASGAANGLIGSYIFANDEEMRHKGELIVSQGREMGFDAKLILKFQSETRDTWVGGKTNIVHTGLVSWPQD